MIKIQALILGWINDERLPKAYLGESRGNNQEKFEWKCAIESLLVFCSKRRIMKLCTLLKTQGPVF